MTGKVYKTGGCCGIAKISVCDSHLNSYVGRNLELDFPQPHHPTECVVCKSLVEPQAQPVSNNAHKA